MNKYDVMGQYDEMTQEDFNSILMDILKETKASEMISVPGFYEIASEEFNNEVLKRWEVKKSLCQ